MEGNDANQNIGLDSIPMPSSDLSHNVNNNDVMESWQRAQSALYSMGNNRAAMVQNTPMIPNFGSPPPFPIFTPIYNSVPHSYPLPNVSTGKNNIPFNYGSLNTPSTTPKSAVNNYFYNPNQMSSSSTQSYCNLIQFFTIKKYNEFLILIF